MAENTSRNRDYKEQAIEYMRTKGATGIKILNSLISRDKTEVVLMEDKCLAVKDDGDLMIYMEDADASLTEKIFQLASNHAEEMSKIEDSWICISVNDKEMAERIETLPGYSDGSILYNCWYEDTTPLVYEKRDDLEVRELRDDEWEIVFNTYTHAGDHPGYVKSLISDRKIIGAYKDGVMTGYVGIHDDGCMGLLEVFPEYRNLGIGRYLLEVLIEKQRNDGNIAFGHVESFNTLAHGMYERMGCTIEKEPTYWAFFH